MGPPLLPQNLNVASDATTIYEHGQLIPLRVADLLGNEVALRQLVNTLNLANRANEGLKNDVEALKLERAGLLAQPAMAIFFGVVNVLGVVLVGIGINYVTANPPVRLGTAITVAGGALCVITAAGPVLLPSLIRWFRGERNDDAH